MSDIKLDDHDRTVWGKCPKCCASYPGKKVGDYFAMAYSRKNWARKPKCENCDTEMQYMYEVK